MATISFDLTLQLNKLVQFNMKQLKFVHKLVEIVANVGIQFPAIGQYGKSKWLEKIKIL